MAEYKRQTDIKAVCSTQEARDYFKSKGLSYQKVEPGDISVLVDFLRDEIDVSNKNGETATGQLKFHQEIKMNTTEEGTLKCCFLEVDDYYFDGRECISFNTDGFIGFAGWADQGNVNPILRAFLRWCDTLAETKAS
jgi:hypothetical protein